MDAPSAEENETSARSDWRGFRRLVDGSDETHGFALGEGHALRHRAHAVALRIQIRAGDFPAARKTARAFLLPAYRRAYPFGHPPLAAHLALLAKIERFSAARFCPRRRGTAPRAAMLRVCQGQFADVPRGGAEPARDRARARRVGRRVVERGKRVVVGEEEEEEEDAREESSE